MTSPRFVGTHIVTTDVARLVRFYEVLLEQPAVGSEEYVAFRLPGLTFAICSQCAFEAFLPEASVPAANRSMTLDFRVEDVDAERRRLEPLIPAFVREPVTLPRGNRSMLFRDPDRNLVNFYSRSASLRLE
jgi:predicted enzyme related to lactoylglutathione lyase